MILVVTHSTDITADLVIRHLVARRAPFLRISTDLLGTPERHFGFDNDGPIAKYDHHIIRAEAISAVWARRFALPSSLQQIKPEYRMFASRELRDVMEAFLDSVRGAMVNSYEADRKAGNRLLQSRIAKFVGFSVPESLVTQDKNEAKRFAEKHRVITKAVSYGVLTVDGDQVAHTTSLGDPFEFRGLECCPALLQERINKKCEWRVTTVGDQVFAARTRSDVDVDQTDWRRSHNVGDLFEAFELPSDVSRKLLKLCAHSEIRFGAHDLIETPEGEFYFLETNPAGQEL
jgi:glutathione synthase/RimK-type ligase-like ATP-grasp enzyme